MQVPAVVDRQLRRPFVDYALCLLLKRRRMALPQVDPARVWPGFEEAPARVRVLPKGDWSAPAIDLLVLMKVAAAARPRRMVELGSYRGHTAVALLEHAGPEASLVAVDIDPGHGEAYAGTPLADRVDRRVGPIGLERFDSSEKGAFDLVFVDADHRRAAVEHDTEVALQLVGPDGIVLWHDYANWGWFTGDCGVPEVLNELAEERPVAHLLGSNIAVHLPRWTAHPDELDELVAATAADLGAGHWRSRTARRYSI